MDVTSTPITRDKKRSFNTSQRIAIFLVADGKCQICKCSLDNTLWHTDHIKPWHLGGPTQVENGQALCASCNLKKGGQFNGQ